MSNIYTAAEQLIGRTPLLRLLRMEAAHNLNCRLLVKLESANPGGSAKDRVARAMLDDAEDRGLISSGSTIIVMVNSIPIAAFWMFLFKCVHFFLKLFICNKFFGGILLWQKEYQIL